ncbi:hypothetical protein QTG56_24540 (plasmid) [Rossellomorea sp. AcN35-11]|nr:hypothetical protein [Rossellomorea aquimaris]WJV31804.1 hypothetical protein QTG56_24540 [Rossellomorea sp. AcN35-11]
MKKIDTLTVYHGRNNHDDVTEDIMFFSSDENFSKDYGQVKQYTITIQEPFHTCEKEHVTRLLERVSLLKDTYDDQEYTNYDELSEAGLFYRDTWEIFEPHIRKIEQLGFNGMIIYEGGIENYICFHNTQYSQKH